MTSLESSQSRKRDRETFDEDLEEPCSVPANFLEMLEQQEQVQRQLEFEREASESLPTPPVSKRAASPARSSTGELTDPGAETPSRGVSPALPASDTPTAFAAMNGNGQPPAKKAKLTFAEREMKRINKEIRDRERAEEKARKDAEKKALADEKVRKEGEREAEKQAVAAEKSRKEVERKKREAEKEEKRVAHEAEKAAKEEKRRKKEEEKQKKEDEKRKKERSQLKLGNFFAIPAASNRSRTNSVDSHGRTSMSPAPSNPIIAAVASPAAALTPSKLHRTPYEELFPSFYKKDDVTVAPISRFQRDEEAIEALQNTIDGYLVGNKTPDTQRAFDALSLFHLDASHEMVPRGRQYMPIRDIMSEFNPGSSSKVAIDLTTTDSQNSQIKRTSELLRKIPMKILHFREDVRPPYKGTYTKRPTTSTMKLARNPLRRDLPNTDYDYDSEAEWVEDEDGEDLKSDGEDEEDIDDGEDMDGFLDDENDELANSKRLVIQGDLEPVSTGMCWEDRTKRSTNVKMLKYRMEVILDPKIKSIDPFSTSYWEPAPVTSMDPPRLPLKTMKSTSASQNALPASSKPVKPFFGSPGVTKSSPSTPSTPSEPPAPKDKDGKPKKMLPAEDLPAFKAALVGSDLSKVGLIEVLKKRFPGRAGAAIKNTLETIAKRGEKGEKEKDKRWALIEP